MNAVIVGSDAAGPTLYHGAGALPTASAVMADIIDLSRGATLLSPGFDSAGMQGREIQPVSESVSSSYLRLKVEDKPGAMTSIAAILSEQGISIEAMIQKDARQGEAQIAMLTSEVQEARMAASVTKLESLDAVAGSAARIRVADF